MLARKSSGPPPSFASGATVSQQVVLPRTTFSTSLRPCCHRPSSARRLRSQLVRRHLLCVFGLFETRINAPGPPLPATYTCKVGTRTRIATSRVGSKSVAPAFNRCVASRLILIPIGLGREYRGEVFPWQRQISGAIGQVLHYQSSLTRNVVELRAGVDGHL